MAGLLDLIGVPAGLLGIGGLPFDEQNFRKMQPGGMPDWMRTAPMTIPQGAGFGPDEMSSVPRQAGAPMQIAPPVAQPMGLGMPQLDGDNNPIPGLGMAMPGMGAPAPQPSPMASVPQAPAMTPPVPNGLPAPAAGPSGGGIGDRLMAGIGGLASGGPMGMVRGLIGGHGTGPRTQAYQMLIQQGVDPQTAMMATVSKEVFQNFVANRLKPQGTDDIREYEYAKSQGFKGTFAEWNDRKRAGAGEYGLNPIWGTDKDGNPAVIQLGKSGQAIQSRLPEGFKPAKDGGRLDLGTHWGILDPTTRQVVRTIPKDLVGKEAAEERGKAQGQAQAELPAVEITANRTIKQIDEFMGSEGFNEVFGALDQYRPNFTMSDKGREALARFTQLSGRAFLEGRAMLKGGGAITDFESNKAEMAVARLSRSLNEADAKKALEDFKEAVREGAAKLRAKASGGAANPAAPSGAPDPLGLR